MAGVDDLDPKNEDVVEAGNSEFAEPETDADSGTEAESEAISAPEADAAEAEIDAEAVTDVAADADEAVTETETETETEAVADSNADADDAVTETESEAGSAPEAVAEDRSEAAPEAEAHPELLTETQPDVSAQAKTHQTFSPSPIPILDRPPVESSSSYADVDVNDIYSEDSTSDAASIHDSGSNEAAATDSELDVDATAVRPAIPTTDVAGGDSAAVETTVLAAAEDHADSTRVLPAADANEPVASSPIRTSYKNPAESSETAPVSQAIAAEGVQQAASQPAEQPHAGVAPAQSSQASHNFDSVTGIGAKSAQGSTSTFSEFEEEKQGRGFVKGIIGAAVAVIVLGGGYAAAQYAYADQIAKDVTVAGVNVGGMTEAEAAEKIDKELTAKLSDDLDIKAGDLQTSLVPADSGFSLDAKNTVAGLTGFSWSPARLLEHLTGGDPVEPKMIVDDATLSEAIKSVESSLYVEPVDGTVAFVDGEAVSTDAKDGVGIDVEAARASIQANLFSSTRPVVLNPTEIAPEITQAITDDALATAQKIASAAVTVEVDGQKAEIPQSAFTEDVNVAFKDGQPVFTFDGKKLKKEVVKRTTDLQTDAEDATFVFVEGKPQIKEGKSGKTLNAKTLAAAFETAATGDDRVAKVDLEETDPADSTAKLEALGIKEKVSSFSTPITNEPIRTKNLQVAAQRITGYLVKPGEEFNLMNVIGPVTVANGYYSAGVIVNGVHTEGVGGGLSQVSTTSYNAGFFAGMTDIAHRPHTVWFNRYPEGRESTLFSGSIDMIWRNDSKTGILMRAYVSGGKLTVEAWGTKTYKVDTTTSPRRNVTPATMTTSTAAGCTYYPVGNPGFTVTVTRKVTEIDSGKVVIDEANSWTYRPDNGVTCKKAETSKSKSSSSDD